MRKIVIKCDRCGKEIEGNPIKIIPEYAHRESGDLWPDGNTKDNIAYEQEMIDKDFCEECVRKILRYSQGGMKPNPEFEQAVQEMIKDDTPPNVKPDNTIDMAQIDKLEEIVKEVEEPKRGRQRLDTGKIMALTKAGWPASKIAEEMGVNPQAIYDARCRLKKEGKL